MRGLAVTALVFSSTLLSAAAPPSAGYVGSNVCKSCHPDVWSTFYKNPHYKSLVADKPPADAGCESCHGPGQAHVEARGGKATIVAFSELKPKPILDNCLRCHAETLSRANIRRSTHTLNDVVCTSCHSIHKSPVPKFLLAKRQADLCYGCHNEIRAQFSMPFKHRVNEGFMTCTDCHNPHGSFAATWRMSDRPRLVDTAAANEEPCLKCHAEKRGPFLYEHEPVRVEGCETCHYPHGSTNSRLLRRPVVFTLCLECHNGADSFGRQNSGVLTLTGTHNLALPRYQNCTTCHVRVHGSNSDPTFLR